MASFVLSKFVDIFEIWPISALTNWRMFCLCFFVFFLFNYRGRKRFVSEGDGGHIKPEMLNYRDWVRLNSKPIYLKTTAKQKWIKRCTWKHKQNKKNLRNKTHTYTKLHDGHGTDNTHTNNNIISSNPKV